MVGTAKTGFIPYVIDVNTFIYFDSLEPRDVIFVQHFDHTLLV